MKYPKIIKEATKPAPKRSKAKAKATLADKQKMVVRSINRDCTFFPKGTCKSGLGCSFNYGPNDTRPQNFPAAPVTEVVRKRNGEKRNMRNKKTHPNDCPIRVFGFRY